MYRKPPDRLPEKIGGAHAMTAVVWANILLALPFLITFIVVPLWWTFKRPQTGADHTEARTYLRTAPPSPRP